MGRLSTPDACRPIRFLGVFPIGVRGHWTIEDNRCLASPTPPPAPSITNDLLSSDPLEGYADIHVHQMANLAFGGSIVWGSAFGPPDIALTPIPDQFRHGHETAEGAVTGRPLQVILNGRIRGYWHDERGAPDFSSWPRASIWTHQQVYEDWLLRAYRGGLRLMVMLAANSEDVFGRGENALPLPLRHRVFQPAKMPGRSANDMESLEWQVREAYRMQAAIDARAGGRGRGWYRIVRDPEEAGLIISQGKLAVILGTELQHLFNCDSDRPTCTDAAIVEGLNRLEGMGVNYVFPIHHKANQFGGPAMFQPLNHGASQKCADLAHKCSTEGLTTRGRFLIAELMARGMLIDTEHLSRRAFAEALDIAEAAHYPVLAGHVVPFDLQTGDAQTERARTADQLRRIFRVGGIAAPILSVSSGEYAGAGRVAIRCDDPHEGGGPDQWANVYFFLRDLAAAEGAPTRAIPFGSDWNGFGGLPGPRFDADDGCVPRKTRTGQVVDKEQPVTYPITLPPALVQAETSGTSTLGRFEWPVGVRQWDYNQVGTAHIGMLPDFIQNLRQLGITLADLEPLYRSARGVVDLWKAAGARNVPGDRHSVRWVPDSPFDVIPFEYRDDARDVQAMDGYPLCKPRNAEVLGYVLNGRCVLVSHASSPTIRTVDRRISVYHSGRCMDLAAPSKSGSAAVQRTCSGIASQHWTLTRSSNGRLQFRNDASGLCLSSPALPVRGARVFQEHCAESPAQEWREARIGNSFNVQAGAADLCLEVGRESRSDGTVIREQPCTGAANQLWSIDALRENDFERLYQTRARGTTWAITATATHSLPVLVGGRAICRSTDATHWLGTVDGTECLGTTYSGEQVRSPDFETLFQSP
jgi:microsomal dipeptidase-like Zn-dependent dipeptidase